MDLREYGRLYMINEMLFGQSREQIEAMARDTGAPLHVNAEHCYILLTGVSKQEYSARLKFDRTFYMELVYVHLQSFLDKLAAEEDVDIDMGVLNYDYSKRIIIIISPHCTRYDPLPCAQKISNMLEQQYRRIGAENPHFSNIMAVSGRISGYEQIQHEFKRLMQLHELSFFHRTNRPMTWEMMLERRVPCSVVETERTIADLVDAVYRMDTADAEGQLRRLMMEQLKPCQDMALCREVYYLLRQRIRAAALVLGVPTSVVDDFPHAGSFISIDEQYEAMRRFMHEHLLRQARRPGQPGRLSILAMTYINQNYYKPIGLEDVARYIHTNTAYLSRVFKKEIGIGVSEYLGRLRVDQAQRLLRETNLKITQIAEQVGVADAHYFSSLFRRYTGMSPVEYRKESASAKQKDE